MFISAWLRLLKKQKKQIYNLPFEDCGWAMEIKFTSTCCGSRVKSQAALGFLFR